VTDMKIGKILIDTDAARISVNGRRVRLTGNEFRILALLLRANGSPVTKDLILHDLYGEMNEPESEIVKVFVCKLRKKLAHATGGEHHIETVYGKGYALRAKTEGRHENRG